MTNNWIINWYHPSGRGGGQVVSETAFNSDEQSSTPTEVYNFCCKIVVEKNINKQKDAEVDPFKKEIVHQSYLYPCLWLPCVPSGYHTGSYYDGYLCSKTGGTGHRCLAIVEHHYIYITYLLRFLA